MKIVFFSWKNSTWLNENGDEQKESFIWYFDLFFFLSLKQDIFKVWKLDSNRVVKMLLYKNKISQEKYKY